MPSFDFTNLPTFENLPKVEGMPQGCAWGVFDKHGKKDELGTLNFLTAENCRSVAKTEIEHGVRVQLDWSLDNMHRPGFGRKATTHNIIDLKFLGFVANDDELHLNPQNGSQWDGLRHLAHQASGKFYNGLEQSQIHDGTEPLRNGIQNWVQNGGIAGRGVLVDWLSWHEANKGKAPTPEVTRSIPLSEIKQTLEAQNTKLLPGDLLIVRTGFVRWQNSATLDEKSHHQKNGGAAIGIEQTTEVVQWLWDNHFSAVACDTIAFEAWPPTSPLILHEWLLAQWGCPIGELWNLEELSEICKRLNRHSFFLVSAPLHVKGGVSSTANAVAIL